MWRSHTPTPLPHLTACRASEISVRVSPASSPLAFPSLAGSPVSGMEHAHKLGEVARSSWPRPRSVAPPPAGSVELHTKGSSGTCIPDGVTTFLHAVFTAHGAKAEGSRLQADVRRGPPGEPPPPGPVGPDTRRRPAWAWRPLRRPSR